MVQRQRLAADQQFLEATQVARVVVDHGVEQGGRQPGCAHAVRCDRGREARPRRHGLVVQDTATAVEQRAPHFQRRGIETERREDTLVKGFDIDVVRDVGKARITLLRPAG